MTNTIFVLLVGGVSDGKRVMIDGDTYTPRNEIYTRRIITFPTEQTLTIYALESLSDYEATAMLIDKYLHTSR